MDFLNAETAPYVRFNTSMGNFVCELYWDHAPKTCNNFAELARRKYYDGIIFHRIIPEFMIQTGDPTGDKFDDEIDGSLLHVGAGILSMANSGPNTNSSQFFITLAPTQHLDGKHTIFGRISAGMKVIQKIGVVNTDANDKPLQDIKIVKAYPTDSSAL